MFRPLFLIVWPTVVLGLLCLRADAAELPKYMSTNELARVASRVKPVIEKLAGRKYRKPVPVRLARNLAQILKKQGSTPTDDKKTGKRKEHECLGLYVPAKGEVLIMTDTYWAIRRRASEHDTRQLIHETLFHELTHALDDQHGFIQNPRPDFLEIAESKLAKAITRKAVEEGHAEHVARRAALRSGIYVHAIPDTRAVAEVRVWQALGVEDMFDQFTRELMIFCYYEGFQFFRFLGRVGGTNAINAALESPPPCMHYIREPWMYLTDLTNGVLTTYAKLGSALDRVPDFRTWNMHPDPLLFDTGLESFGLKRSGYFLGAPGNVRRPVAAWARTYEHKKNKQATIFLLVQRYRTAIGAGRIRTSLVKTSKPLAVRTAAKGEVPPYWWAKRADNGPPHYGLVCDVEELLIRMQVRVPPEMKVEDLRKTVELVLLRLARLRRRARPGRRP